MGEQSNALPLHFAPVNSAEKISKGHYNSIARLLKSKYKMRSWNNNSTVHRGV
jgi:hypothetical protein